MKDLSGRACARAAQGIVRQHEGRAWSIANAPFKQGGGERILVIEDAVLLAELVCDFLRDCGMEPVGPAGRLEAGCEFARACALDGAILDVKLREGTSFAIAALLEARRIPFVFVTGYNERSQIPAEFSAAPLVCKPFEDDELGAALGLILDRPATVPLLAGPAPAFDPGRLTDGVSAKA